jgi:hypothetical protein
MLMRRTWELDVLACPRCGERMDLIALSEDSQVAAKILIHLGQPARAPPRGRPWRPGQQQLAVGFDGVDSAFIE